MKFKNWQRIYQILLWFSWISVAIFIISAIAIEGFTGSFSINIWYGYGMLVSIVIAVASILLWAILAKLIDLAQKENNLISRDLEKSRNIKKTYYWYNTGTNQRYHHKIMLLGQSKKLHELKFTPTGIFSNTHWFFLLDAKEQLLLWKDVERVIIQRGIITLNFYNAQEIEESKDYDSKTHYLNGMLVIGTQYYIANKTQSCCYLQKNEVFLKLIQTFYGGEIEYCKENDNGITDNTANDLPIYK